MKIIYSNLRLIITTLGLFFMLWCFADIKTAFIFTVFVLGMFFFNYGICALYSSLKSNGFKLRGLFIGKKGLQILLLLLPMIVIIFILILPKLLLLMSITLSIGVLLPLWIYDVVKKKH